MSSENFKNWTALFSSNFLGVFNDNLLKNGIIFFAIEWSLPPWMTDSQLITLASAALIFIGFFQPPENSLIQNGFRTRKVLFKLFL